MPKSDIQSAIDDVVSKLDIMKDGNDGFEKNFNKKRVEFGKAHEAMWECKETIEKCQKELKKVSDARKVQDLAGEIEENEKAFKKVASALDTAAKELSMVASGANGNERIIREQDKALDKIEKEMAKSGVDAKQVKEWEKTIKGLRKMVNAEATRAFTVVDEVKNLPKTPKL